VAELSNKNILIAMVKSSRSTEFRRRGILDSALIIGLDALKIAEKAGAPFVASGCLSEIGYIHQLKNQNQKAIDYYNQALKYLDPAKITDVHITNLVRLGEVYQKLGEINKSVNYLKEAIKKAEVIKSNENLKDAYQKLADIYFKSSKYKEAYQSLKKYHNVKDSIFNIENAQIIASVQTKYLADDREKAIELLNQKNEIKDLQLAKNKNKLLFLAALFLVILGMALFIYYRYRMKANAHNLMERSNREKDLLLQEVHHRIKNNLQLISSLLDWQFENIYEEKMLKILEEGKSRIGSIALIHEMLYQSKDFNSIDLKKYFDDLLYRIEGSYKDRNIVIVKNINSVTLEVDIIIPIGLIITELVTNSLKYAFPFHQTGVMEITLTKGDGNTCLLEIKDNGIGIPHEFIRKNSTNTMGLELVKTLVKQIKGKLEIYNDNGANFLISFSSIKMRKNSIKSYNEEYECINS
jgi:two-component sensor histidine kinase